MLERQGRKWEMLSLGFASFRPSARDAEAFGVREIGIERVESLKIGDFLYLRSSFPKMGKRFLLVCFDCQLDSLVLSEGDSAGGFRPVWVVPSLLTGSKAV